MSADSEALKRELDARGYVVIPHVLSPEVTARHVERLNSVYRDLTARHAQVYPGGFGTSERLILNLHNKDEAFIDLIDHPTALPLIAHLLMTGSYRNSEPFIVTQFSARDPHKGTGGQQLHIDSRFPGPPYALMGLALWMMNDFTPESGATRLVPGSHRRAEYPGDGVTYGDEIVVKAPAGSLLIYNGSLWHGGGGKTVDVERWSVIVSYARWFVKPAFEMTRNTPASLYQKLSPSRRQLFGFTSVPPSDERRRLRTLVDPNELPDVLPSDFD